MSRAFDRFLADLRADGARKKDGFDPAALRDMRADERAEALVLLRAAVRDGDETAVAALPLVDPVAGPSFLRECLRESPHEAVRVRIVALLLEAGRDPEAEEALATLLRSRHGVVRQQAISATRHLWSTRARLELLPQVLDGEPDAMNRMLAAGELLQACGRHAGDGRAPDYRVTLDRLRSGDPEVRAAALAGLGVGG